MTTHDARKTGKASLGATPTNVVYDVIVLGSQLSGAVAGALLVKRGDNVKRGQVIARVGQSGNVTAPQLHFELRKGSSPVDPTPYLTK